MIKNKRVEKGWSKVLSGGLLKVSLAILLFVIPHISHAETRVRGMDVKNNWIWNKAGSPYILEAPIYIPNGYSLYIGEGVEVRSAAYIESNGPNTLTIDGILNIAGTNDNPVKINNLYSLYFLSSESSIRNAIFTGTGLDLENSTTTIESTTIQNTFEAITAKASNIKALKSRLINNTYGITSNNLSSEPIFQAQNTIIINDSEISGNSQFGIMNHTPNVIDARDIWWGNRNGPNVENIADKVYLGDGISGPIDIEPWKSTDPNKKIIIACCSNVIFIPGVEASRLYRDKTIASIKTTDMLWEPNTNSDMSDLAMDENGISIRNNIYTKDIIDSAYGLKGIYKNLGLAMNKMVTDGLIKSWESLPYDWRNSVTDISSDANIQKIYDLASTSRNGKVTIVAHSNGGLVAKAIMKKLEAVGKSSLVDKLIMVATPELGTSQALLGMLHGYGQSILGGAFFSENTSRKFSQNLPGAYGLLPSKRFFEYNPLTVITDSFTKGLNMSIASYADMKNFVLQNSFSKKSSSDLSNPLMLNSKIFGMSETMHDLLDTWKSASSTKTLGIFGWGMSTSESILYQRDPHCNPILPDLCDLNFVPNLTHDGDGTVLTRSTSNNSDSSLFFNLKELKTDTGKDKSHANIMESDELISKIKDTITNAASAGTSYEKYFTSEKPVDNDMYLTIKIYSPVDIDIYDKEGRHTGLVANFDSQKSLDKIENNIPGSYYGDFGRVKIAMIPYDSKKYDIVLSGNDTGLFIVQADITKGGSILASTTFSEMLVTPLTNIELIVPTSTQAFDTGTLMNIDIDGDGTTDYVNRSNTFLNATSTHLISNMPTYLALMRKVISSLSLPEGKERLLLKRIEKFENAISKNHPRKVEKLEKKLSKKIFKTKKMNAVEKAETVNKIYELLQRVDVH